MTAPQFPGQGQQVLQGVGRVFGAGLETAAEAYLQSRGVPIGPHQHSGLLGDRYSPGSGGFGQNFGNQGFGGQGFNGGGQGFGGPGFGRRGIRPGGLGGFGGFGK